MTYKNLDLFKSIELESDYFSSIKYNQYATDIFYLFKLKQKTALFEYIKNIDVIFQNQNIFNDNFKNEDLTLTEDHKKYSNNYNDNEIFEYYRDNFDFNIATSHFDNSNSNNFILTFEKSDLKLVDNNYIYFLINSSESARIKNINNGNIRIIIRGVNNNILFDSSFIENNLRNTYLNAKIDTQNFIFDFIFNQYTENVDFYYARTNLRPDDFSDPDPYIFINFPKINDSFLSEVSLVFSYNNVDYFTKTINNFNNDLLLNENIEGSNFIFDLIKNYNNNLDALFKFELHINFTTRVVIGYLDDGSELFAVNTFSKIVTKEFERSSNTIKRIVEDCLDNYNLQNLNKIFLDCTTEYIQNGEVLKIKCETSFNNVDTKNIYLQDILINDNKIYNIYRHESLKNNFIPLYNKVDISEYFNIDEDSSETNLFIDSRNIYLLNNIKFNLCYFDNDINQTRIRTIQIETKKNYLNQFQTEKFFKLSEFNITIKDSLDIDVGLNLDFINSNKLCTLNRLQIKNITALDSIAYNFNYQQFEDKFLNIQSLLNNSFCNIQINTFINNTMFNKSVYCKLSEVGLFNNNDYEFNRSFLEKVEVNIFDIINTLSLKNKKTFDFIFKTNKADMLEALSFKDNFTDGSFSIRQEVIIKVLPVPYDISLFFNAGLNISGNINYDVSLLQTKSQADYASFLFYNYLYQINPNMSYQVFLNIKKSYFDPKIDDNTFMFSIFEFIYNNYVNSQNIFKYTNIFNKEYIIDQVQKMPETKRSENSNISLTKEELINNKISQNAVYKNKFLNFVNNSREIGSYKNKVVHRIISIKDNFEANNIVQLKDLIIFHNKKLVLNADIIDIISKHNNIKIVDINLCLLPVVSSFYSSNSISKDIISNKKINISLKDKMCLSPNLEYYKQFKHLNSALFKGLSQKDFIIKKNNISTILSLNSDKNIVTHDFYKLNHMLYLNDFFQTCLYNKFNILDELNLIYSVNIATSDNNFYKKEYSLNLLEKLDKKIYIIDSLENIVFMKNE